MLKNNYYKSETPKGDANKNLFEDTNSAQKQELIIKFDESNYRGRSGKTIAFSRWDAHLQLSIQGELARFLSYSPYSITIICFEWT